MRVFAWQRVLDSHRIAYIERGPNVKRGHLNIKCPFCGTADPSFHLGLNLDTGWWACWRNQNHRGKSPLRLLVRLLGVSYFKAREIAGLDDDYIDPEGFDAVAARILGNTATKPEEVHRDFLHFPKEFRDIVPSGGTRRHWEYLVKQRGFPAGDIDDVCSRYALKGAISGAYKDRVIFPFLIGHELVSWTGRAIVDAQLRYRDLSIDESLVPPKETLFNHDATLTGGDYLIVVEGPIDAVKLDFYGCDWGVRAVGLATNSISDNQIYIIEEASERFTKILFMMDNASSLGVVDSMRLKERLSQVRNLGFSKVPRGYKDSGELPPSHIVTFCRSLP